MRNKGYEVTIDTAFERVLTGCADREEGTWLGRAMRSAYVTLHRAGYAHSFETWRGDELVGGLYGVAVGRMVMWQPHELADEVKRGLWFVLPAKPELLLRKPTDSLWEDLVGRCEREANTI